MRFTIRFPTNIKAGSFTEILFFLLCCNFRWAAPNKTFDRRPSDSGFFYTFAEKFAP